MAQGVLLPFIAFVMLMNMAAAFLMLLERAGQSGTAGSGIQAFIARNRGDLAALETMLALLIALIPFLKRIRVEVPAMEQTLDHISGEEEKKRMRNQPGEGKAGAGLRFQRQAMLLLGTILISVGLNLLFSITGITSSSQSDLETLELQYSASIGMAYAVFGVLGPIVEETFFRGFLWGRLRQLTSPWMAILASALLFGIYHGNPVQLLYAFLMGLLLGLSMETAHRLAVPCITHAAVNLVSVTLTYTKAIEALATPAMTAALLTGGAILVIWFILSGVPAQDLQ